VADLPPQADLVDLAVVLVRLLPRHGAQRREHHSREQHHPQHKDLDPEGDVLLARSQAERAHQDQGDEHGEGPGGHRRQCAPTQDLLEVQRHGHEDQPGQRGRGARDGLEQAVPLFRLIAQHRPVIRRAPPAELGNRLVTA
jgi:hypothetical protein